MSDSESSAVAAAHGGPIEAASSTPAGWHLPDRTPLTREVVTAAQVGLAALLISQFNLESVVFQQLAYLTLFGYIVHICLPRPARLSFFVLLSMAGIWLVLGWQTSAWLVGIGLVLIGTCHLPLPFAARAGVLILIAMVLAVMRVGVVTAPWSIAIWPILGSLFMFRLIIYLYDLRHAQIPTNPLRSLAYFFLLPNVCFPLFPVVDYATFCRTYDSGDSLQGRQTGVRWILRGILHLILYRFIYLNVTLAPVSIDDAGGLVQFLVSNYLLYLRISGQFHVAIGMLHLFGFNLPETHHLYYLASGFNDFWRRINIYWKDFMMKLVFYPTFFRLRGMGSTRALVLSTVIVFLATWMLHSYQWFWILGSFPLTWQDGLFWTILCVFVIANSLREARTGRDRSLGSRSWSLRQDGLRTARVAGMFVLMCVLWSLWTSDSLGQWSALWTSAVNDRGDMFRLATLTVLVMLGVATCVAVSEMRAFSGLVSERARVYSFTGTAFANTGIIVVLFVVGSPISWDGIGGAPSRVAASLRESRLNYVDQTRLEHGYYQRLLNVQRVNTQLWEALTRQPELTWLFDTDAGRFTHRFDLRELFPSRTTLFLGETLSTNQWGMRDGEYPLQKPDDTYRIALLGASGSMGWGVGDDETYEARLERRLNQDGIAGRYPRYEILNFSVAGYSPLAQVWSTDHRVWLFNPDALFIEGLEPARAARGLAELVAGIPQAASDGGPSTAGTDIPYPFLRDVIQRADVTRDMDIDAVESRLHRYGTALLTWSYERIAERCHQAGVLPVALLLPSLSPGSLDLVAATAEAAGFVVVDLTWVTDGWDWDDVLVSETDSHPSAWGHELYAEGLLTALKGHSQLRGNLFGYMPLP